MNKLLRALIWAVIIILAVIILLAIAGRIAGRPIFDKAYTCPDAKYVDCMPKIYRPGEFFDKEATPCSGSYYEWIKKNCDVEFVY